MSGDYMDKDSKIYVAGHRGLVGSAIKRNLESKGYDNFVVRKHQSVDLLNQWEVERFFSAEKPEYVVMAAAKVGGIYANMTYPELIRAGSLYIVYDFVKKEHALKMLLSS